MDIIPEVDEKYVLGTQAKKWASISCKTLYVENLSVDGDTYDVLGDTATQTGIVIDANNKPAFPDNVTDPVTFEGAVTFSTTSTFSGIATHNAKVSFNANLELTTNANIDMGTSWINDDGTDSSGLSFATGGQGKFADGLQVTGNLVLAGTTSNLKLGTSNFLNGSGSDSAGVSFDGSDNMTQTGDLSTTGKITAGNRFWSGGNQGITGTITLSAITGIQVHGGIIYGTV